LIETTEKRTTIYSVIDLFGISRGTFRGFIIFHYCTRSVSKLNRFDSDIGAATHTHTHTHTHLLGEGITALTLLQSCRSQFRMSERKEEYQSAAVAAG